MAELSETARKLIDAGMAKDEPPPADESWGTLVSRLTEDSPRAALPDHEAGAEQPASRRRFWILLAVATSVALVAVWWWSRPPPAVPPVVAEELARPAIARAPAKAASLPTTQPEPPPLEQLLVDAEAALTAGDPDRAMALLQRHAERAAIHPQATRRMALRVLVLCAQGKQDQARDEARAFLSAHGQSQWSDALRRSCAAP